MINPINHYSVWTAWIMNRFLEHWVFLFFLIHWLIIQYFYLKLSRPQKALIWSQKRQTKTATDTFPANLAVLRFWGYICILEAINSFLQYQFCLLNSWLSIYFLFCNSVIWSYLTNNFDSFTLQVIQKICHQLLCLTATGKLAL